MNFTIYSYTDYEGGVHSLNVLNHEGRWYASLSNSEIHRFFERAIRDGGGVNAISPEIAGLEFNRGTFDNPDLGEIALEDFLAMFYMEKIKPLRTVYSVSRQYGGPEEGGWWYDHYNAERVLEDNEELEEEPNKRPRYYTNGTPDLVVIEEISYGQHNTTTRPQYC